jgi:hypothetical protein
MGSDSILLCFLKLKSVGWVEEGNPTFLSLLFSREIQINLTGENPLIYKTG